MQRGMCPDCGALLCATEGAVMCLRCGFSSDLRDTITATFAGSIKSDDDRQNSEGRL